MPLGNPSPGANSAVEYSVPGIPWITSSVTGIQQIIQHSFPQITNSVVTKNSLSSTNNLRVGFTQNGLMGSNYVELVPGESIAMDVRIIDLFVSGSSTAYTVYAELTAIERKMQMLLLTGSSGIQGIG
jgi:hypothetical protein